MDFKQRLKDKMRARGMKSVDGLMAQMIRQGHNPPSRSTIDKYIQDPKRFNSLHRALCDVLEVSPNELDKIIG